MVDSGLVSAGCWRRLLCVLLFVATWSSTPAGAQPGLNVQIIGVNGEPAADATIEVYLDPGLHGSEGLYALWPQPHGAIPPGAPIHVTGFDPSDVSSRLKASGHIWVVRQREAAAHVSFPRLSGEISLKREFEKSSSTSWDPKESPYHMRW